MEAGIILLLKNRFHFGRLLRAMLAVCVLQISAVSHAQSVVSPEFYGLTPTFTISEEVLSFKPKERLKSSLKQSAVGKATQVFQPLAGQIRELADKHNFPDRMQIQLVIKTAKKIYQTEPEQTLAAVGIMRAMGFNALLLEFRDGDSGEGNSYGVAVASRQKIFGGMMFELEKTVFILIDLQKETVKKKRNSSAASTVVLGVEHVSDGGLRAIDLGFSVMPRLPIQHQKVTLNWSDKHGSYSLPVTVNTNLVRYDASCPQLDIGLHLNRPVSPKMITGLIEPLRKIVVQKNFSEEDAVQFLMSFCHHAFNHLDDLKNTGVEHHNSVEETLVANASDCEDFVLLFSVLVRGVLGYPVIGLEYPNHLSLAVALPKEGDTNGVTYQYKGKTYVHCDPSFVGGKFGEVQPDFEDTDPKVVPIGNLFLYGN